MALKANNLSRFDELMGKLLAVTVVADEAESGRSKHDLRMDIWRVSVAVLLIVFSVPGCELRYLGLKGGNDKRH